MTRLALKGALLASLFGVLGACSSLPGGTTILVPSADLLANCPEPSSDAATNEDLVNRFLDMRNALRRCNADKRALRTWAEEVQKDNPKD